MSSVKSLIESQNRMRKIMGSPIIEAINSNRKVIESISYPREILKSNTELLKSTSLNQEFMSVSKRLEIKGISNYLNYDSFKYIKQVNEIHNSFRVQYAHISNLQSVLGVKQYIAQVNYKDLVSATAMVQSTLKTLNIDYNNIYLEDNDVETITNFIHYMNDDTEDLNWQQKVASWINEVKNKYPVLIFVLNLIIANVIATQLLQPINNLIDSIPTLLESRSSENLKLNIQKDIKGYMRENVYNDFYEFKDYIFNTYRFINCDDVYLRKSPKMNSYVIEKVTKGDVIKIIRKNNHWSYVEYENKDGEILNGWINTRYTKRFD